MRGTDEIEEPVIVLAEGETAVVGYGLLLGRGTVDKTLGRAYEGPFLLASLEGWHRSWNASMPTGAFFFETDEGRCYPPSILYLNAHRSAGRRINCSLFVVNDEELGMLDAREWIYDRLVVNDSLRGVRIAGGDVVIYSCKDEHLAEPGSDPRQLALRRSFLRLLDGVLDGLDPDVRSVFLSTTEEIPLQIVVDDALDPDRGDPWSAAGHRFAPEVPGASARDDSSTHPHRLV